MKIKMKIILIMQIIVESFQIIIMKPVIKTIMKESMKIMEIAMKILIKPMK
jgi:hypothetical protein